MIRRCFLLTITLAMVLSLTVGCTSIQNMMKGSSSPSSTSKTPQGTYASVPASMRAPVKEAQYDLQQSQSDLKVAKEQVKLSELKKERATVEKKRADLALKLAETTIKKNKVTIELRKLEAIDNANLGDKASNIKKIANQKTKELSIESDAVKTKADIDTLDLQIKKLNKKINLQARKVEGSK